MVSVACAEFADVAVIVALCCEPTTDVFNGNVPLLCPPGITRLAGTVAVPLLDESVTSTPFAGAGEDRVTVPMEDAPP
jgi:hypothetical protein